MYIHQLIQLARQGIKSVDFPEFTTDWDSEAYNTVSGQSSNNSVRLTTEFMRAVLEDDKMNKQKKIQGRKKGRRLKHVRSGIELHIRLGFVLIRVCSFILLSMSGIHALLMAR